MIRILFTAFFSTLLVGCVTVLTPVMPNSQVSLKPEYGYILVGINSDIIVSALGFYGDTSITLTTYGPNSEDIILGEQYKKTLLTPIKAGKYRFSRVYMGLLSQQKFYIRKKEEWEFDVHPGKINYIGDVFIRVAPAPSNKIYMERVNRSSFAQQYVEAHHREQVLILPTVYSGFGNDDFFQFVQSGYETQRQGVKREK